MRWRQIGLSTDQVADIVENPDTETPTFEGRTNSWRRRNGDWIRVTWIIENNVTVVISRAVGSSSDTFCGRGAQPPVNVCTNRCSKPRRRRPSGLESAALHIELGTTTPVKSRDIFDGMSIDLDEGGQLIGVEILDATKRLGKDALAELVVEGLTTTVRPVEPATIYEVITRDVVGSHSQNAE